MSKISNKELAEIISKISSFNSDLGEIVLIKSSKFNKEGGTSFVKNIEIKIEKESIKEKFVIKFLSENIQEKISKRYKRFKQAYFNLLLLKNKNYTIPQIHFGKYQFNEEIIIPYLIMQKADQQKLKQVSSFKKFNEQFKQLLNCIDYIHSNNIIHRDLKPDNIFEFDGRIVLADFDISKFEDIDNINLVKTGKGDFLGNRDYSSPEQSEKNGKITFKSDWYAFGWLINYLITGNKPKKGTNLNISYSIYGNDYIKYENLVKKLISVNPIDRPGNKNEILGLIKNEDNNKIKKVPKTEKENIENFKENILKYINGDKICSILEADKDIENFLLDLSLSINLNSNFFSYIQGTYKYSHINNIKKTYDKKNWLIDNIEINISKIYLYGRQILGSQFFIIESRDLNLKIKNNDNIIDEWEEYKLYKNNKIINNEDISPNGYSKIEGKLIDISKDTHLYYRQLKKNIFIVLPDGLMKWEDNDIKLNKFYDDYLKNGKKMDLNNLKNLRLLPYKCYNKF